jgi:hypothetical protein
VYLGKILDNVELVQERTARILQDQERDLLRAFRARLFDVQTELEKEKSKKDDGAGAWIEKSRQLESEVSGFCMDGEVHNTVSHCIPLCCVFNVCRWSGRKKLLTAWSE